MKLSVITRRFALAGLVVTVLSACASPLPADHDKHHPQAKVKTQTSAMGMGEGHEEMRGNADQMAFCAMHQELMSASPEERRAVMAEHMKTMPPDMMKKHMEMMGTQMDMMREHMNSSMM